MKFASDDIAEDIKKILPQEKMVNFDNQDKLILNRDQLPTSNTTNNSIIAHSVKVDYDKWATAAANSVTTSFYSNQIIYNEQGIADWVCKCCEYLRMKIGDGYSAIFKQPFREG